MDHGRNEVGPCVSPDFSINGEAFAGLKFFDAAGSGWAIIRINRGAESIERNPFLYLSRLMSAGSL